MHKELIKYRIKFCDALEKARREGGRERSSIINKFSFFKSSPFSASFFFLSLPEL